MTYRNRTEAEEVAAIRNTVNVQMLGGFTISCGDATVAESGRSHKVWLLLSYLIYNHRRLIPREELIQLLGGSENSADPGGALRMARMRARRVLEPISAAAGQELLVGRGSAYGWNPDVPLTLDAEVFETLCREGASAEDPDLQAERFEAALPLYRGEFLEQLSGESWVDPLLAYYHELYFGAATTILPQLESESRWRESADLCRQALKVSPYHEPLYRQLMRSLMAMGDALGAEMVYRELREALTSDLGIMPSEETQTLYQSIARSVNNQYISPDVIRDRLREEARPMGAMLCDYASFKLFYQAEARSADRRGDSVHIGVLTVTGKDGKTLSPRALERAMEQLGVQIERTLRIGDVATCCSGSQYILLLVQANFEDSLMICQRVERGFARAHTHSPARIESTVLPLEPVAGEAVSKL